MNIDAMFASPWGALAIFCLRFVDVSCDTMRVIFAIRGKRGIAAMLGFILACIDALHRQDADVRRKADRTGLAGWFGGWF